MNTGYAPPAVPIFKLFLRMGGWIELILGLLVLSLSMVSSEELVLAERFEAEGAIAAAIVAQRDVEKKRDRTGSEQVTYRLDIEFVTNTRRDMRARIKVSKDTFEQVRKGTVLDVRYLTSDPGKVELANGPNHRKKSITTQIAALILGVIWLVIFWIIGRWCVDAVQARRVGERLQARVDEIRRSKIRFNNRDRYRLIWTDGRGRQGFSLRHRRGDLKGFAPGDMITIYRGARSDWWEGDVGRRRTAGK